jgi:hypothetical protein
LSPTEAATLRFTAQSNTHARKQLTDSSMVTQIFLTVPEMLPRSLTAQMDSKQTQSVSWLPPKTRARLFLTGRESRDTKKLRLRWLDICSIQMDSSI